MERVLRADSVVQFMKRDNLFNNLPNFLPRRRAEELFYDQFVTVSDQALANNINEIKNEALLSTLSKHRINVSNIGPLVKAFSQKVGLYEKYMTQKFNESTQMFTRTAHETDLLTSFETNYKTKVHTAGVVVNHKAPWLFCRPHGFVFKELESLERPVKCSLIKLYAPEDLLCHSFKFCLEKNKLPLFARNGTDRSSVFNKKSDEWLTIQLEMAICGVKETQLIVYNPCVDYKQEEVFYIEREDEGLIPLISQLWFVYFQFILPEFVHSCIVKEKRSVAEEIILNSDLKDEVPLALCAWPEPRKSVSIIKKQNKIDIAWASHDDWDVRDSFYEDDVVADCM